MHELPDAPFLRACRRLPADRIPVWFMRQAGRSLPEYRAIRAKAAMFEIMRSPELTAEVTLQPVRRLGVDAAILFSDIVTPLMAVGVDVELKPEVGPVFAAPVRTDADIDAIRPLEPEADMPWLIESVRLLVSELRDVPLIGFAGAPFTLASYLVEGGPSRDHAQTKAFMLGQPDRWRRLLDRLADIAAASLRAQIAAGAAAFQLFDSWAGALTPAAYRAHVMPATKRVFDALAGLGAPGILFGVGTGELLADFASTGADVVGVDWRVPLEVARGRVGSRAVQGNLDPAVCFAPWPVVEAEARAVIAAAGGAPGHVFNLGWGVLPDTNPDVLRRLVDFVHQQPPPRG